MPQRFNICTSIDITNTGIRNKNANVDAWDIKRNQQRNYDTLIQVIGLRAQPIIVSLETFDNDTAFANLRAITGDDSLKIWRLTIDIEYPDAFGKDFELLKNDLHLVPIVPGLDSTIPAFPPVFLTSGDYQNVVISNTLI